MGTNTSTSVTVHGSTTRFTQDISAGDHQLRSDEPEDLGGKDAGPSPYHLLLAALGACTSITLRMYADRKGWPLEDVRVELSHAKLHAKDCAECPDRTGRVDRIERTIALSGPLDDEQKQRLLDIADKCPVHRTLEAESVIVTQLAS